MKRLQCHEENWVSTSTASCTMRNGLPGVLVCRGSTNREEFGAHSIGYFRVFCKGTDSLEHGLSKAKEGSRSDLN